MLRATAVLAGLVATAQGALVINTWPFTDATDRAWAALDLGGSRVDAVEQGCTQCELDQCDGSVGFGSGQDSTGEVTLDAMIMDGPTRDAGAVGCLRGIHNAIGVARAVMEHTTHTMLVGEKASMFARMRGFKEQSSETPDSIEAYATWRRGNCQPNYFRDMEGVDSSCPPYAASLPSNASAARGGKRRLTAAHVSRFDHDTIGMVVVDSGGDIATGTSTNGANFKVAGRVGDSPIIGSGAYVDNEVGAAAATGDGDIMMRYAPSLRAVLNMKAGMTPTEACEAPLREIAQHHSGFTGALVCANKAGEHGGAGVGWNFAYSYRTTGMEAAEVVNVPPLSPLN